MASWIKCGGTNLFCSSTGNFHICDMTCEKVWDPERFIFVCPITGKISRMMNEGKVKRLREETDEVPCKRFSCDPSDWGIAN